MFSLEPSSPPDTAAAFDTSMSAAAAHGHSLAINIPGAYAGMAGRKRKAADDADDGTLAFGGSLTERRKLSFPKCMPGTANELAQFHPLPDEVNRQVLAGLNLLPGQENASMLFHSLQQQQQTPPFAFPGASDSPTSPNSELQPSTPADGSSSSGGFYSRHAAAYPDFDIYPPNGSNDGASTSRSRLDSSSSRATTLSSGPAFGIFEPTAGAVAEDGMYVDDDCSGAPAQTGHGPWCQSIPQLSVRTYGGQASQLWATCPDCGACTKVSENTPSTAMAYSP